MKRLLASALVVAVVTASAADSKRDPSQIGGRNVARGVNFYSLEKELALGKQLYLEVQKQARFVDDPLLSEYINRLGQTLARNSDANFPLSFTLFEADEIEAFTLPGGYIFVSTGVFRLSDNEAELASVISHELAHAAARHATRQATRNELVTMGTVPLGLLGIWGSLASLGAPLAFFRFSRGFENEADLLGVEYLWKAGYDPNASVDMFERVQASEKKRPGSVSRLFMSHPLTADRIARTQENISRILPARSEYVLNSSDYEEMRARLKSLTAARKPETPDKPTLARPGENF